MKGVKGYVSHIEVDVRGRLDVAHSFVESVYNMVSKIYEPIAVQIC